MLCASVSSCFVQIEKNRKYAKWKAAYIHKCLKNGETPLPGPLAEEGEGRNHSQHGSLMYSWWS